MTQPAQHPISQFPQFEVIEFSKRRLQRGLAPLSMRVVHGEGDDDVLWLSPEELRQYILQYGPLEALLAGQELYRRRGGASSRGDLE